MRDRKDIKGFGRLVIKVGSSSIAYQDGKPNLSRLESLARELSDLHNRGVEVILVTSG
ncbi:MAG: amino acid kinase family protein, partial [Desulfocucumaceae bacterium]